MTSIRHIALVVPDLRTAEAYYRPLFEMQLIGREAQLDDGLWYTLPFDKSWDDAEAAGIAPGMVALRKEDFVLALFQGERPSGQIFAIGLHMIEDEIARVRVRLGTDVAVLEERPDSLTFHDRYQIMWQISVPGNQFRTAGEFANRWLQL
jgi:catechol 2,3-dioxygenase-like lactoylglutathione lyase family enzyme